MLFSACFNKVIHTVLGRLREMEYFLLSTTTHLENYKAVNSKMCTDNVAFQMVLAATPGLAPSPKKVQLSFAACSF